jgi:hypothetical protein
MLILHRDSEMKLISGREGGGGGGGEREIVTDWLEKLDYAR